MAWPEMTICCYPLAMELLVFARGGGVEVAAEAWLDLEQENKQINKTRQLRCFNLESNLYYIINEHRFPHWQVKY